VRSSANSTTYYNRSLDFSFHAKPWRRPPAARRHSCLDEQLDAHLFPLWRSPPFGCREGRGEAVDQPLERRSSTVARADARQLCRAEEEISPRPSTATLLAEGDGKCHSRAGAQPIAASVSLMAVGAQ